MGGRGRPARRGSSFTTSRSRQESDDVAAALFGKVAMLVAGNEEPIVVGHRRDVATVGVEEQPRLPASTAPSRAVPIV